VIVTSLRSLRIQSLSRRNRVDIVDTYPSESSYSPVGDSMCSHQPHSLAHLADWALLTLCDVMCFVFSFFFAARCSPCATSFSIPRGVDAMRVVTKIAGLDCSNSPCVLPNRISLDFGASMDLNRPSSLVERHGFAEAVSR
jgi:hypothetical protein